MGLFDKLKGVKEPEEGTPVLPRDELAERLMAVNEDRVPFTVAAGKGGEEGDLVAEWKIVDATWYEIFAKAGLEKSHRILLVLDEKENEVRALEQSMDVEWSAGVPNLSFSAEKFQGRTLGEQELRHRLRVQGRQPARLRRGLQVPLRRLRDEGAADRGHHGGRVELRSGHHEREALGLEIWRRGAGAVDTEPAPLLDRLIWGISGDRA